METKLAEDRTGKLVDQAGARERLSEDVKLVWGERSFLFWVSLIGFVCGLALAFLIPVRFAPLSPQPSIHGQKLSFEPTHNLEIGFLRTTVYGGPGYPLTIRTLLSSVFVTASLQTAFQAQSSFQRMAKSPERTTTGDGGHT